MHILYMKLVKIGMSPDITQALIQYNFTLYQHKQNTQFSKTTNKHH